MKRILSIGLILAINFLVTIAVADQKLASTINQSIEKYIDSHFCNCVYLFAIGDKVISKGANGFYSIESKQKLVPDQQMPIASATKTMTAALILKLQHRGKLNVRDKISKHLGPRSSVWENGQMPKWANQITIHNLLTHTSGLAEYFMATEPDVSKKISDIEIDIARFAATKPLNFTPGSKHYYCNTNFALLGLIIEEITGKELHVVYEEEIFKPLGMKNTRLMSLDEALFNQRDENGGFHPVRYFTIPTGYYSPYITAAEADHLMVPYSDGGVVSTTEDLLKWQRALHGGKVLPKHLYRLMISKHQQIPCQVIGKRQYSGYGIFMIEMEDGQMIYHHSGNAMAIRSESGYIPSKNLYFVILSNTMEYIPSQLNGMIDFSQDCNQLDIKYFIKYVIESIRDSKKRV